MRLMNSDKTVGDCPDFPMPGEENGTVPFAETVLLEFLSTAASIGSSNADNLKEHSLRRLGH
jgi:hypothetical protein